MFDEVRRQRVPLQEWFNRQRETTDDELIYKSASGRQIIFVRDEIVSVAWAGERYDPDRVTCWVISEHRSKSVRLPVYSIERPGIGLQLVLRGNFYNWKLSVISEKPVECDFSGLFHTTSPVEPDYTGNPLSSVYFEGFPPELIFGYFGESDGRRWSAEIGSDEALWTTLFLLVRSLGHVKPMIWHTRESHSKKLDEDRAHFRELDARRKAHALDGK